eukprot:TRINITY_DN5379_c0_g1_i2.p1 TRINITY_DN5379_c0_g1~~TRINITY_DN5379_c0_g1_i2.p1  ORF type:complete len:554 (-),score=130.93 TRINITY_DN5379_c0_g1_i2:459-1901(-)
MDVLGERRLFSSSSRRRAAYQSTSKGSGKSGRQSNSLISFIIGCFLWCLVPAFLWNNERIAIKQYKLQAKARHDVVVVEDPKREPVDELEGHIVFMSGTSQCDETLVDAYFPSIKSQNCVKLRRIVQMYQWEEEEHEEKNDRDETYTWYSYNMVWADTELSCPHDSGGSHQNPPMPIPSSSPGSLHRIARFRGSTAGEPCAEAPESTVRLGAYYCGDYVRRELENWQDKSLDAEKLDSCAQLQKRGTPQLQGKWWVYGSGHQLGDVRVRFEELQCGPLSVCGVLAKTARGWTFVPLIRADLALQESCAAELGCTELLPCCKEKPMVFTSDGDQDDELLERLNAIDTETSPEQQRQFRLLMDTREAGFYEAGPEDDGFCCTWLISRKTLSKCMAFFGLEEEFLGVKEDNVTHEGLMQDEGKAARSRHCCARIIGVILGLVASMLILEPVTSFLNSNWLIFLLGVASCRALLACSPSSSALL